MSPDDSYSEVADAQLDELQKSSDADLYNAVLDACELVFTIPGKARSLSSTVATSDGKVILRLPVAGQAPYKVFWTSEGPRIEAVFPHP